jgi:mono/diheme cytochrome c family protein
MLCLCAALVACGSAGVSGQAGAGHRLFEQNCSICHSLIGSESLRREGGDLLRYRLSRQDLLEFAREMPVRRPLRAEQLAAVVDYVLDAQRRGR